MLDFHRSRRILPIIAILVAGLASPEAAVLGQTAPPIYDGNDPDIVQVVEAGTQLPSQDIVYVTDVPATFSIQIEGGSATFDGGSTTELVTLSSPGWLVQPAITAGALQDESIVHFRKADDDSPVAESRNVFSTDTASLNEVFTEIPVTDPSYLDSGSSHYVMDLRLVTNTRSTTFGSSSGSTTFGGAQVAGSAGIDGLTACIRTPFGPGRVFWDFSNPRGAGYSHKPESQDNVLHWASPPVQDTDGVYRQSWGCCNAFKVPNSCDLHVTSSGFSWWACCNWAAAQAGKVPEWINPCDEDLGDWPNCPLCE